MRRLAFLAVLHAFVAAGAGCASPRSNFYALGPAQNPSATGAAYSVAVGPVSVPAAVDRPQIVVRTGPHQVAIDEFNRWAAPLPDAIAGAVAGNLAAMLGTPHVTVFPQPTSAGARYRAIIDVRVFDSEPGKMATLDAVWTVRGAKEGVARSGRTAVSEAVGDTGYPALVAAHNRALGRLSGELAEAIRAMEQAGNPVGRESR